MKTNFIIKIIKVQFLLFFLTGNLFLSGQKDSIPGSTVSLKLPPHFFPQGEEEAVVDDPCISITNTEDTGSGILKNGCDNGGEVTIQACWDQFCDDYDDECTYHIEADIGGNSVDVLGAFFDVGNSTGNCISGTFTYNDIVNSLPDLNPNPNKVNYLTLNLKVIKRCTKTVLVSGDEPEYYTIHPRSTVKSVNFNFQAVNVGGGNTPGGVYKKIKFLSDAIYPEFPCDKPIDPDKKQAKTCCDPETKISIANTNVKFDAELGTDDAPEVSIDFNIGVETPLGGISLGGHDSQEISKAVYDFHGDGVIEVLEGTWSPKNGECVRVVLVQEGNLYEEQVIQVNSCGNETLLQVKEVFFPNSIKGHPCRYKRDKPCPPMEGIGDKQIGNKLAGQKSSTEEPCTGSIDFTITSGTPVSAVWTGADGFKFTGEDLNDVPLGSYTLIMKDECCNIFERTFHLCSETISTDWALNSTTDEYCRMITCVGSSGPGKSSSITRKTGDCDQEYEECVKPEEWTFNETNKKCYREVIYNGEVIFVDDKDAEFKDTYDDFSEKCIRDYYCIDGAKVSTDEEDPEYGEEEYDDFHEVCYREIICFDETTEEQQEEDPELGDWEYDDFFDECFRIITCFGEEMDDRIEETPEVEWEYEYGEDCEGTVFCDGYEVTTINKDPESIDWEWDESGFYCLAEVSCEWGDICCEVAVGPSFIDLGVDLDECPEAGDHKWEVECGGEEMGEYVCSNGNPQIAGVETRNIKFYSEQKDNPLMKFLVYPNPSYESVFLEIDSEKKMQTTLAVQNNNGKRILKKKMNLSIGHNRVQLEESIDWNPGVYFVQLYDSKEKVIGRVKITKF